MTDHDYRVPVEDEMQPGYYPELSKVVGKGINIGKLDYRVAPAFNLADLAASLEDTTGRDATRLIDTGAAIVGYGHVSFSVTQVGYFGANLGVSPGGFAALPVWEVHGVMDMSDDGDYSSYIYIRMVITTNPDGSFEYAYFHTCP